jgi:hypothetical protein
MNTLACRHCGKQIHRLTLRYHEQYCIEQPDLLDRVREVILDMSHNKHGRIVTASGYERLRPSYDKHLPSAPTLVAHFGSWDDVAVWLGLLPTKLHGNAGRQTVERRIDEDVEERRRDIVARADHDLNLPQGLPVSYSYETKLRLRGRLRRVVVYGLR